MVINGNRNCFPQFDSNIGGCLYRVKLANNNYSRATATAIDTATAAAAAALTLHFNVTILLLPQSFSCFFTFVFSFLANFQHENFHSVAICCCLYMSNYTKCGEA